MQRVKIKRRQGRSCSKKWANFNQASYLKNTKKWQKKAKRVFHRSRHLSRIRDLNRSTKTGVTRLSIGWQTLPIVLQMEDREQDKRIIMSRKDHSLVSNAMHLVLLDTNRAKYQSRNQLIRRQFLTRSRWTNLALSTWATQVLNSNRVIVKFRHFRPPTNSEHLSEFHLAHRTCLHLAAITIPSQTNKTQSAKK